MNPDRELFEVELPGVPVDTWVRASAHQEAIQREFDILRSDLPLDSVPNRLAALAKRLDLQFGDVGAQALRMIQEALDAGNQETDLRLQVPRDAATGARHMLEMMSEVDEYCRQGTTLLTLATPPDLVAFRSWVLGEFANQLSNEPRPPTRWQRATQPEAPATPDGGEGRSVVDPDGNTASDAHIAFVGDLDLSNVAILRQRIQKRAQGVSGVTLDLTGVGFMDSVGMSLLVSAHARMIEEGVPVRLVMSPRFKPLIEMSGLIDVLQPEFSGD